LSRSVETKGERASSGYNLGKLRTSRMKRHEWLRLISVLLAALKKEKKGESPERIGGLWHHRWVVSGPKKGGNFWRKSFFIWFKFLVGGKGGSELEGISCRLVAGRLIEKGMGKRKTTT